MKSDPIEFIALEKLLRFAKEECYALRQDILDVERATCAAKMSFQKLSTSSSDRARQRKVYLQRTLEALEVAQHHATNQFDLTQTEIEKLSHLMALSGASPLPTDVETSATSSRKTTQSQDAA